MYLHSTYSKPKLLPKLKGLFIESIAWNKEAKEPENITGSILLGTNKGKIFETCFDSGTQKSTMSILSKEAQPFCKPVLVGPN